MSAITTKILPRALTTYDIYKFAAVAVMIVDHIGYYFYPEDNWWRVAGRLCVPVWFFLVGYARSRDMGPAMWIGAAILVPASMVAGMYVFPLNILATILAVRMVLDPLMARTLGNPRAFWAMSGVLFALALPTMMVVEYGTQALILAIFGYLARRRHDGDPVVQETLLIRYMAFATLTFVVYQFISFGFVGPQVQALCVGLLAVDFALLMFRPGTVPGTETGLGRALAIPIQLVGRHTLFIYVAHLLLFKAAALAWQPDFYRFMSWQWMLGV